TTGFLGTPQLLPVLSRTNHFDVAYGLLMQRSYPSWLYPITRGATTMWERWDGIRPDSSFQEISMNSFNHYAFGAIGDWMYRTIGGLEVDAAAPGYKHAIIAPRPGGGLTSAETSLDTPYGALATSWRVDNARFSLDVVVPPNTSATVTLWDPKAGEVEGVAGVRSVRQRGSDVVV